MNRVVTGASGNVGKALVDTLVEKQECVFGINKSSTQRIDVINECYIYLEADLTVMEDIQHIVQIVHDRKGEINV